MPKFSGEPDFKHGQRTRIGVLLANLGSPDEATTKSVRRYLAEFLMDPRVVEVPRIIWRVILHGVILRIRPRRKRFHTIPWCFPLIAVGRTSIELMSSVVLQPDPLLVFILRNIRNADSDGIPFAHEIFNDEQPGVSC